MGTRDHAPLSADAVPPGGDADRPAGRRRHDRQAGQEQAEAHPRRAGGEAGQGPEGRQVRRVLGSHTGLYCDSRERVVNVFVYAVVYYYY